MHEFASPADKSDPFSFDFDSPTPYGDQPDVTIAPLEYTAGAPPLPEPMEPTIVAREGRQGRGALAASDIPPEKRPITARVPQEDSAGETEPAAESTDEATDMPDTPPRDISVPEDIHTLLDNALIPTGWPGGDTLKYLVEGHPDLVVRTNADDQISHAQHAERARTAIERLRDHGVNVVPYKNIVHNGQFYVVTNHVEGANLEVVLQRNPGDELMHTVDANWTAVCENVIDCFETDQLIPDDVRGAHQYMVGTLSDDTQQRLWLVDIPRYAFAVGSDSSYPGAREGEYEGELLGIAWGIRRIEDLSSRRLEGARNALDRAFSLVDESERGQIMRRVAQRLLDHTEHVIGRTIVPHPHVNTPPEQQG